MLLGLGISLARALKILLGLGLNPPNRDQAPSMLSSFAGLGNTSCEVLCNYVKIKYHMAWNRNGIVEI